jgi:hypothetical protein
MCQYIGYAILGLLALYGLCGLFIWWCIAHAPLVDENEVEIDDTGI